MDEYEYRMVVIPRDMGKAEARRWLAELADVERWELSRVRLYLGGARRAWLRRRVVRVRRTA